VVVVVFVAVVAEVSVAVIIVAATEIGKKHKTSGPNQDHTVSQRICISHLYLVGAACSGAGKRAYPAPETVRAGCLFSPPIHRCYRCTSDSLLDHLISSVGINIIISVYIVHYNLLCSITIVYCAPSYMFRPIYMTIFGLLHEEVFYNTVQLCYNYITCHTRSRIMCITVVGS
jgi:hypothetical protein